MKYRVYVRCPGCATERSVFHSKNGAPFSGQLTMGKLGRTDRAAYTYEAWFRSPLEGKSRQEILVVSHQVWSSSESVVNEPRACIRPLARPPLS